MLLVFAHALEDSAYNKIQIIKNLFQGWQYSENTEFSKWNLSSLNQFEAITSAKDIKSFRYSLTEFKNYCFHLYQDVWSNDDNDWFFVTPNFTKSLHHLFTVPGVQPCSINYYNHIMGKYLI